MTNADLVCLSPGRTYLYTAVLFILFFVKKQSKAHEWIIDMLLSLADLGQCEQDAEKSLLTPA